MSLSVSYNQSINKGIDTSALREVTQAIFQRAESKTSDISSLDFTKFRRPELGMDLYSGKVDSTVARQVAMSKAGMDVTINESVIKSVQYLNNQASMSIHKVVDGKVNAAVNEGTVDAKKTSELPKFSQLVKTTDLGQDKNGSNPFYKGELLKVKKEEKDENLNIFA